MISRRVFMKSLCLAAGSMYFAGCSEAGSPEPDNGEWKPAYTRFEDQGLFKERIQEAYARLESCNLCPHRCGVNRLRGETGFCEAPGRAVVHSHTPHFGEELPLVGSNGSGTIFFSNCNLRCVFCQNWPIAHEGRGRKVEDEQLAQMMLDLQRRGCHNINLVTPTHVMPHILSATRKAMKKGLKIPLCYNTGGYETVDNIELLEGIVDIYLPDLKFMGRDESARYAIEGRGDYPEMAQAAIREMNRQVGVLDRDSRGIARRGVILRHLVMPNRAAGTREFVQWVADNLPRDTYVNIMSQYRVEHMAFEYEEIARSINSREFVEAVQWAREAGLENLDERSMSQYRIHRRRMS